MRPRTKAWIGLAGAIVAWDVCADDGETLSDASREAMNANPLITGTAITATALHLTGKLPPWADPIHWVAALFRFLWSEVRRRLNGRHQSAELSS